MGSLWPWNWRRKREELLLEELEPRILYSADAAALLVPDTPAPQAEVRTLEAYAAPATAESGPPAQPDVASTVVTVATGTAPVTREIAFVDASDQDYQSLVDDLLANPDPGRHIDVVVIDSTRDGVEQISEALAGRHDIDAVHLISHGTDGAIMLGNSVLSGQNLAAYEVQIAAWGDALGGHRDLLIYGCGVAENADGKALIDALARLTGADVAASTDATGSARRAGDWTLEYQAGVVESAVAPSLAEQQSWNGLLDVSTGLEGLWRFDTGATDASGNGNDGTLTNGVAIDTNAGTNKIGGGKLSLDGVNDFVDLSASRANFTGLTQGTIAGWIKTTSTSGVVLGMSDVADATSGVALWVYSNGKLAYTVYENNVALLDVQSTSSVNNGAWHHVAVTVDGSSNKLYIDGVQASVTYSTGNASTHKFFSDVTGVDSMSIGRDQNNGGGRFHFNGLLDDVRVYSRALTAADIVQLMNVNTPPENSVPVTQTVNEDTARVFSSANGNQISIADGDAGATNNQVTLSVTNGTLTLAGTVGLSFVSGTGSGDTAMTIRGTASAINTAMDGLRFDPSANYNGGATLTLVTDDALLLSLDIDTGLLGHYTFENTGALGTDISPAAGYAGTVVNGSSVNDATRGNVLGLAGNGYVQTTGHFGNPANVTLAAWVNLTTADTSGSVVISLGDSVGIVIDNAGRLDGFYYNGTNWPQTFYTATLAGTGWHHVAFSFDNTGNVVALYLDGAVVGTTSTTDNISYTLGANSFIGKHGDGSTSWDFTGKIDDARVYNRALTASEIATLAADLSMTDTDTVAITVAAVNDAPVATTDTYTVNEDSTLTPNWWNTAWTRRSQITFNGNTFMGATNLTDFPVLLTLNSSNIDYSLTQNGGQDLRFFDADGTPLAYEVETWNESGNSYVWVRVPLIDTTGSDSISMYYGNTAAAAGQNASAVWNSDYSAVYHLNDSGTTVADSTASALSGTATNGPVATTGKVGGDWQLDGTNDYLNLGSNRSFIANGSAATLSLWVNAPSVAGSYGLASVSVNNGGVVNATSRFAIETNGANLHVIVRSDDTTTFTADTTTSPLVAGTWKYISVSVDVATDTVSIFVDGVLQTMTTGGTLPGTAFPGTASASIALVDCNV